jgi:hypothetical protein
MFQLVIEQVSNNTSTMEPNWINNDKRKQDQHIDQQLIGAQAAQASMCSART